MCSVPLISTMKWYLSKAWPFILLVPNVKPHQSNALRVGHVWRVHTALIFNQFQHREHETQPVKFSRAGLTRSMSEGKSQTLQGVKLEIHCILNSSQEPKLFSAIPLWDRYRYKTGRKKQFPSTWPPILLVRICYTGAINNDESPLPTQYITWSAPSPNAMTTCFFSSSKNFKKHSVLK